MARFAALYFRKTLMDRRPVFDGLERLRAYNRHAQSLRSPAPLRSETADHKGFATWLASLRFTSAKPFVDRRPVFDGLERLRAYNRHAQSLRSPAPLRSETADDPQGLRYMARFAALYFRKTLMDRRPVFDGLERLRAYNRHAQSLRSPAPLRSETADDPQGLRYMARFAALYFRKTLYGSPACVRRSRTTSGVQPPRSETAIASAFAVGPAD